MTDILVDSSFLYALYGTKDQKHRIALEFSEQLTASPQIPDVVLTEVTFLLHRGGGIPAVAERLNICKILTFDRRDFSISRPQPKGDIRNCLPATVYCT